MNLSSIHMTLLIGRTIPRPLTSELTQNVDKVEVSQSDEGRSGFQVTFRAGRSGPARDYMLLQHPSLATHNRVIILLIINGLPRVLMDGIIKHQQLNPGNKPGTSTVTITGEDVSVMMDQDEVTKEHPAQNEMIIANKIILQYARYGLIPAVLPPYLIDFPNPVERIPVQRQTDLQYLRTLAARFGYVFYVRSGPAPGSNLAYWGPPIRAGLKPPPLSMNLGAETNVETLDFKYDAKQATKVHGQVQDRTLNQKLPVITFASTRTPPLAAFPALPFDIANVRDTELKDIEGLSYAQAYARAQSITNKSMDNVLTATGELDGARYGAILEARGLVGLRGAGYSYDGFYYIKTVTHQLSDGDYKQQFTLTREGLGSTTPVVF